MNGRFAPGHSGNPAGRPKGSKGLGTRLVAALREGENEIILRTVIEAALMGDKVAARFCAARIDAAASDNRPDPPRLDITRADALDPFILHAKLVQAVVEGKLPAERALELLRVVAAKQRLQPYSEDELTDEEYEALAAEPEEEEDDEDEEESADAAASPGDPPPQPSPAAEAPSNPPPPAGEGAARAAAREGGGPTPSVSDCPLPGPPPHAGEGGQVGRSIGSATTCYSPVLAGTLYE